MFWVHFNITLHIQIFKKNLDQEQRGNTVVEKPARGGGGFKSNIISDATLQLMGKMKDLKK
jgi:hypothetical protein